VPASAPKVADTTNRGSVREAIIRKRNYPRFNEIRDNHGAGHEAGSAKSTQQE